MFPIRNFRRVSARMASIKRPRESDTMPMLDMYSWSCILDYLGEYDLCQMARVSRSYHAMVMDYCTRINNRYRRDPRIQNAIGSILGSASRVGDPLRFGTIGNMKFQKTLDHLLNESIGAFVKDIVDDDGRGVYRLNKKVRYLLDHFPGQYY